MTFLCARRRRARSDGWTDDRIVTFVLTLAATGSVTLAAAAAGLSRKSAYALRARDLRFAGMWNEALAAARAARLAALRARRPAARKEPAPSLSKGDKLDKVDRPIDFIFSRDKRPSALDLAAAEPDVFFAAFDRGPFPHWLHSTGFGSAPSCVPRKTG